MQSPPAFPTRLPVAGVPARSRRRALLLLALLALLLHAAFLGGVGGVGGAATDPPPSVEAGTPMNVRLVEAETPDEPAPPEADTEVPVPVAVATPRRAPVPSTPRGPRAVSVATAASDIAPAVATSASAEASAPSVPDAAASEGMAVAAADPGLPPPVAVAAQAAGDGASAPPATATSTASPAAAASSPAPAASATFLAAGEDPPPTYRTLLPPSATLRYEVRRGFLRGTGEIRWERSGDDYALRLEARIASLTLITQSSQGTVDTDGIAPTRFVDQRARRSAQAANFHRDSGTVTFSGPAMVWPLLAGTQDQLSWMIQLAGIVAAEPERATEGGRITMVIVGARGDASVRTLRFAGIDNAETSGATIPALKFVVDGRATYDTSYEIWLDPARHYLPAHATQRNAAGESQFDLLLERIDLPP